MAESHGVRINLSKKLSAKQNLFALRMPVMVVLLRWITLFVLFVIVPSISSAPVNSEFQALSYLTKFGYLGGSGPGKGNLLNEDTLATAIKDFQRFAGLNETGTLDNETVVMMNTPRCGVKDKVGPSNDARKKRYALQGSKWRTTDLSYRISKYPSSRLSKSDIEQEIKKAFKVWSDHTQLTFTPKSRGQSNIDIRFEKREHGDGDPFDGPGGTLAHAYFPMYGGDAHFDDEERWSINSIRGTNLLQVAAHEFGHSLGLSHSDVKASLMAPFYQGYKSSFKLHDDDIRAIQALYGKKKSEGPHTSNPPKGKPSDGGAGEGELCSDSAIDTVFTAGSQTFAFKGQYYWEVIDDGLADGYPRLIKEDWKGLPTNIDAAFTWSNGKTYFFKGSQYWRFTDKSKDSGYPKPISQGFVGIEDNIDAAFVWSGNDKIYFFKGNKYWKFDPDRKPAVSHEYPKDISIWSGIPSNIDAAFQWTNHYTYFFKGTYYWRFNDRKFTVDNANPPFPRSSAYWWFGCKAMSADNEKPVYNSLHKDSDYRLDVEDKSEDVSEHQPDSFQDALVNRNSGYGVQSTILMIVVALFAQLILL